MQLQLNLCLSVVSSPKGIYQTKILTTNQNTPKKDFKYWMDQFVLTNIYLFNQQQSAFFIIFTLILVVQVGMQFHIPVSDWPTRVTEISIGLRFKSLYQTIWTSSRSHQDLTNVEFKHNN